MVGQVAAARNDVMSTRQLGPCHRWQHRCMQAYQNERNAPEILQYQEALVTRVEGLIADRVRSARRPPAPCIAQRQLTCSKLYSFVQESLMVSYEQDRERSFLISMMNFDLARGELAMNQHACLRTVRLRTLLAD